MPLSSSDVKESFSISDNDIKKLFPDILYSNLQRDSDQQQIISITNQLLSVSKTRLQGLEYLNLFIKNCPADIIVHNALTWISNCMIKHQEESLKELKLKTIGKIIEKVHSDHEFSKKFVSDYISKLFEVCLSTHVNPDEVGTAIDTLVILMKYYPSWFAIHKSKLEQFFVGFLDSSWESHVEKAAVAFHFLQQVRGVGMDGNNPRTNFSTSFHKLCVTIHKLFDTFFENENEIFQVDSTDEEGFSFKTMHHYSHKMVHLTARRIRNCLTFVTEMLLNSFPVVKDIIPLEVLDVISRGTAIHHCLSGDDTKSLLESQFSLLLNDMQIKLLQLLKVFIIWCQTSLLPFSYTVTKILIDCLHRCQNCECFESDRMYQQTVYQVLSIWLRIPKSSTPVHLQRQLLTCILKDIIPVKTQVTLSIKIGDKNKSAKARRQALQEKNIPSGQLGGTTLELTDLKKLNQEKNCLFALVTLKYLLTKTALSVESNFLQDVYSSILNVLMDICVANISHPYTNIDCQIKLYQVLVACYEQDTLKVFPPLQQTLDVLNKGANDENRHIASICEDSLSILEKLCQPLCPPLHMPELENSAVRNENNFEHSVENTIISNVSEQSENKKVSKEPVKSVEENISEDVENDTAENDRVENDMAENETSVVEEKSNNDSHSRLSKEKAINIIDIQIIKSSENDMEVQLNAVDMSIREDTYQDSDVEFTKKSESNKEECSVETGQNYDVEFTKKLESNEERSVETGQDSDAEFTKKLEIKKEVCSFKTEPIQEEGRNEGTNLNVTNIEEEISILKNEVLSCASIEIKQSNSFAEGVLNNEDDVVEPPTKKCKTDNEEDGHIELKSEDVEVKLESVSEEIDDLFEEDNDIAFVDEVKEY